MSERSTRAVFIRNVIFGIEDSLVSTVGLLAGIEVGQVPQHTILLTGCIYILVEGFSMAVGSYLSEESVEEYAIRSASESTLPFWGAVTMFISFVLAGLVPLAPYLFLTNALALGWSAALSLLLLLVLGYVNARISKLPAGWRGVRMMLLGGFAILIGVVVGKVFGVS